MKKMMLNDRYGLTDAVIEKRKTVTRRELKMTRPRSLANCLKGMKYECMVDENDNQHEAPYYVGEIVAVAQSYFNALSPCDWIIHRINKDTKGWSNKMFIKAELMPHKIRILDIRAEKLQDVTEEDCLREGIYKDECKTYFNGYAFDLTRCEGNCILATQWYKSPIEAFSALIDKISGKGTWDSNPFVWRIEFELIAEK